MYHAAHYSTREGLNLIDDRVIVFISFTFFQLEIFQLGNNY